MLLPYKAHSDTIEEQRLWTQKWLSMEDPDYSSKGWGYVDRYNPGLGDYKKIRDLLISKCLNKDTLDLGCLDGKWSEVIKNTCSSLTLVDLSDELLPVLTRKIGENFTFYQTKGDELSGLNSQSIDLIFSMDSLVRVPNNIYIKNYFIEFNRVLRIGGEIIMHLPCTEIPGSRIRGFTKLAIKDIKEICRLSGFKIIDLNTNILEHGILLLAQKI